MCVCVAVLWCWLSGFLCVCVCVCVSAPQAGGKDCKLLLSTATVRTQAVANLVTIAQHFGFDGWLLNIETPLEASDVPLMKLFVRRTVDGCLRWEGQRLMLCVHTGACARLTS